MLFNLVEIILILLFLVDNWLWLNFVEFYYVFEFVWIQSKLVKYDLIWLNLVEINWFQLN